MPHGALEIQARSNTGFPSVYLHAIADNPKIPVKEISQYQLIGELPDPEIGMVAFSDDQRGQIIVYGTNLEGCSVALYLVDWASRTSINIAVSKIASLHGHPHI